MSDPLPYPPTVGTLPVRTARPGVLGPVVFLLGGLLVAGGMVTQYVGWCVATQHIGLSEFHTLYEYDFAASLATGFGVLLVGVGATARWIRPTAFSALAGPSAQVRGVITVVVGMLGAAIVMGGAFFGAWEDEASFYGISLNLALGMEELPILLEGLGLACLALAVFVSWLDSP